MRLALYPGVSYIFLSSPCAGLYFPDFAKQQGVNVDKAQALSDTSLTRTGSSVKMAFTRTNDNGGNNVLDYDTPLNLNWAKGNSDTLGQHSSQNRGSFVVCIGGDDGD